MLIPRFIIKSVKDSKDWEIIDTKNEIESIIIASPNGVRHGFCIAHIRCHLLNCKYQLEYKNSDWGLIVAESCSKMLKEISKTIQ